MIAREPLAEGELVVFWGGKVLDRASFETMPDNQRCMGLQVSDDLFLLSLNGDETADFINHSCGPNLGMFGSNALVAMRHILPGEELTFDYAMIDSSSYDEFQCRCGKPACRGRVGGDDWQDPNLQMRYRGYFAAYLQRKIDMLPVA